AASFQDCRNRISATRRDCRPESWCVEVPSSSPGSAIDAPLAARPDGLVEFVADIAEHFLRRRDSGGLHALDEHPSRDAEQLLRFVLVQALDAHQLEYRKLAHARAKVRFGKLRVEYVGGQIDFDFHDGYAPNFRNCPGDVK